MPPTILYVTTSAFTRGCCATRLLPGLAPFFSCFSRSEEHTSELQSRLHLVCRLLLEKKKHPHDIHVQLPRPRGLRRCSRASLYLRAFCGSERRRARQHRRQRLDDSAHSSPDSRSSYH